MVGSIRRVRAAMVAAALVVGGAAAVVMPVQDAAAAPACAQPHSIAGQAVPHVSCPQSRLRASAAANQSPSPDPSSDMTNHGGKVMTNSLVYNIFWLPAGQHFESPGSAATDTSYENLLNRFFGAVGNSDLMRIMTQYPGSNGTPALGPSDRLAGSYTDTTAYPHAGSSADPLTDGDIQAAATRAASTNSWSTDINHIYMVYTAFGIDECNGAGNCNYPATATVANPTSGFNYCAYHTYFGGGPTVYAFMGDDASEQYATAGCSIGSSPNSDTPADSEVSTASHEYFEALTDPQLDGWFHTDTSGEIGDLCAYNTGPSGAVNSVGANLYLNSQPYIIQQEWSNAIHGCSNDVNAALNSDQPPTVSLSKSGPSSAVVGQTVSYTVTVNNPSDTNASTLTTITDVLPSNLAFVSSTPSPSSANTWDLGTIAVHDTKTITIQATVQHAATTQNCASGSYDDEFQITSHTLSSTCSSSISVSQAATTTALTSSVNPSVFAQSVTFTATVSATAPGSGTPTGSVQFYDGSNPLGSPVPLDGSAQAALTTSALSVGDHTITATYSGSSDYLGSSTMLTQVVQRQPTTTTLSCVPPTSHVNQAVTCTATVSQTISNATAITGTVSFYLDGASTPAFTGPVSSGQAVWITTFGGGTHSIVAVYNGDTNYLPSTSSPASETVLCDVTITGNHGALIVGSGTTCVLNAHITGGITVTKGAILDVENSVVSGSISASAPAALRLCHSSMSSIGVTKATGFVLIGDPANNCGPNVDSGGLTATYNTGGLVIIGNTISGGLTATGNSGAGPLPSEVAPIIAGNHH